LLLVVLVCLLHVPDEPTDRTYLESANSYRCEGVLGNQRLVWIRNAKNIFSIEDKVYQQQQEKSFHNAILHNQRKQWQIQASL